MRRNIAGLASAFTFVALACTGSDPDAPPTDQRGAENQACFENGTCRGTLACVTGLCVAGNDGATGSPNDASNSKPTDAGDNDAGIDPACMRDGAVCDSFDGQLDALWVSEQDGGGASSIDGAKAFAGSSLASMLPGPSNSHAAGRRTRTIPSNGAGTWFTRVWIEPVATGADPQAVLELTLVNGDDPRPGFQLLNTADGFAIALAGTSDVIEKTLAVPSNQWIAVRADFDFAAQQVVIVFGDKPDVADDNSFRANGIKFGSGAPITGVNLALGLKANATGGPAHAWFNDLQFIPK